MSTEQILKVLKNERECIKRQSRPLGEMPQCRKDDDGVKLCEYCDLCMPDDEILEVYDFLIKVCEQDAIIVADISEEDKRVIIKTLAKAGYGIAPELEKKYLGVVDFSEINPITPADRLKAPFERLKESLNEHLGIKQPGKVMADFWQKGDTE